MRKPIKIGQKEYKFKKDAISHYRTILNSYDFGQSLNDSNFDDLIDLLEFDYFNYLTESEDSDDISENSATENTNNTEIAEDAYDIIDIKVAQVQFSTKCFEIFYKNGESQYISYLMIINNQKYNPESLFNKACRNSIQKDLISVKQEYFDKYSVKGQVKCQETGQLSKWEELAVDHRQPNTFSVIVDRFKEVSRIELEKIEYISNENNQIIFKEDSLTQEFTNYHKDKANLRIVRKECNLSRTGMARLKQTTKDLTIK